MGVAYGINPTWAAQTDAGRIHIATKGVVQDGLVLNLDAGASTSYPGSGTNWSDLSGNGNNGTLVNGVGYTADNGGALVFDGTNMGVNTTENLTFGSDDWTLEMWVYLSSGVTAAGLFSFFLSSTSSRSISYFISSNAFGYQHRLNGGSYLTQAGVTTLSDETWYYLVSKRENDVYYTYIDGVQDTVNNSAPADHTYFRDNVPYYIGYNRTGIANLNGKISGVKLYKGKGLTPAEIQQNYNALKGRFQ